MIPFGVTERGDAGLDFSWTQRLCAGNIIISKELNDDLIKALCAFSNRIIFHMTCTGYGGTILEPNVSTVSWTHSQLKKLLEAGFPISQVVLRLDPIIPTDKGIKLASCVLAKFRDSGIKRVRFSFLDMYPYVAKRFFDSKIRRPYDTFTAPKEMRDKALEMISQYENIYVFESCGESNKYACGCISEKDFSLLGIPYTKTAGGYQRAMCMCDGAKTELLKSKRRCLHECLYCYWKD